MQLNLTMFQLSNVLRCIFWFVCCLDPGLHRPHICQGYAVHMPWLCGMIMAMYVYQMYDIRFYRIPTLLSCEWCMCEVCMAYRSCHAAM